MVSAPGGRLGPGRVARLAVGSVTTSKRSIKYAEPS